ncbi:MAG: hypothetical protein AAFY02_00795 [Pseudomonadota bacterium]
MKEPGDDEAEAGDELPAVPLSELMRLGHAYLSITDPDLRREVLRSVERAGGLNARRTRDHH